MVPLGAATELKGWTESLASSMVSLLIDGSSGCSYRTKRLGGVPGLIGGPWPHRWSLASSMVPLGAATELKGLAGSLASSMVPLGAATELKGWAESLASSMVPLG